MSNRRTASAFLMILSTGLAWAQQPWLEVKGSRAAQDLSYRIVTTAKGPAIEFRNTGKERLHFSFRFKEHQTKEAAAFNGRIHQSPGAQPSQLPLPMIRGVEAARVATASVFVYRVTRGLADAGAADPEDD